MCDDQFVCFAASKALVSVLGRKELESHCDCSMLVGAAGLVVFVVSNPFMCQRRYDTRTYQDILTFLSFFVTSLQRAKRRQRA